VVYSARVYFASRGTVPFLCPPLSVYYFFPVILLKHVEALNLFEFMQA